MITTKRNRSTGRWFALVDARNWGVYLDEDYDPGIEWNIETVGEDEERVEEYWTLEERNRWLDD